MSDRFRREDRIGGAWRLARDEGVKNGVAA
jgi:hypothetical protein